MVSCMNGKVYKVSVHMQCEMVGLGKMTCSNCINVCSTNLEREQQQIKSRFQRDCSVWMYCSIVIMLAWTERCINKKNVNIA